MFSKVIKCKYPAKWYDVPSRKMGSMQSIQSVQSMQSMQFVIVPEISCRRSLVQYLSCTHVNGSVSSHMKYHSYSTQTIPSSILKSIIKGGDAGKKKKVLKPTKKTSEFKGGGKRTMRTSPDPPDPATGERTSEYGTRNGSHHTSTLNRSTTLKSPSKKVKLVSSTTTDLFEHTGLVNDMKSEENITLEEFQEKLSQIPPQNDIQVVKLFESIYPPVPKELLKDVEAKRQIWERIFKSYVRIQQPYQMYSILEENPNICLLNIVLSITNSKKKYAITCDLFQKYTGSLQKRLKPNVETIELVTTAFCNLENGHGMRNIINIHCCEGNIQPTPIIIENYLRLLIKEFQLKDAIQYYNNLNEELRMNTSIASLMISHLLQNEYTTEAQAIITQFMEEHPKKVDGNIIKAIIQHIDPVEKLSFLDDVLGSGRYPSIQLDTSLLWMAMKHIVKEGTIEDIIKCLSKYTTVEDRNISHTVVIPTNTFLSQLFSNLLQKEGCNYQFIADLLLYFKPILQDMKMIPDVFKAHRLALDSDDLTREQTLALRELFTKDAHQ